MTASLSCSYDSFYFISTGTSNIIRACLKTNVSRLIFCSTVDVAIGHYPITNGNEDTTAPPGDFLFPGYPESKYKAECLVLEANKMECVNGMIDMAKVI